MILNNQDEINLQKRLSLKVFDIRANQDINKMFVNEYLLSDNSSAKGINV